MTALLLVPILVMSGGAIDLIAQERLRASLQDALDRGVLAAASLTQTRPARETVEGYLKSTIAEDRYNLDIDVENSPNARHVEATAIAAIDTAFLHFVGIDRLEANAHAVAEERRKNVEISLILDVSGSMRFDHTGGYPGLGGDMRIKFMRPAAKSFIDTVLGETAADYTTVNLVPYAGQVSVGPLIFDALGGERRHGRSSCLEFVGSDFALGIPDFRNRRQVQHYTQSNHHHALGRPGELSIVDPWWCPDDPHGPLSDGAPDYVPGEGEDTDITSISLLSNDREFLKSRIDAFKLYDGTGTPIAMKWGLLLLDPAIQPMVSQALRYPEVAEAIGVDPKFDGRPARFDSEDTMKFIVLMTDGAISAQTAPRDEETPIQYYNNTGKNYDKITKSKSEQYFRQLCSTAKDNGIIIFTVGFDVNDTAAAQMQTCASGPEYFYRVNALDIKSAFESIATAIQKIKLIS